MKLKYNVNIMLFQDDNLLRIVVFVLGVCGFLVARHIHEHKKIGKKALVCPMKFDCNAVVHSDYSKLLGIPLEVLGMLYYGLVSVFYLFMIFMLQIPLPLVLFAVSLSIFAFLFSVYLICVQIFILKKGCFWCFVSALISILIFIATVYGYEVLTLMFQFLK